MFVTYGFNRPRLKKVRNYFDKEITVLETELTTEINFRELKLFLVFFFLRIYIYIYIFFFENHIYIYISVAEPGI